MLDLMEKDLRVRLKDGLKPRFDDAIGEMKVSQVDAVNGIIEWFCEQDDVTRAAVVGTLPPSIRTSVARMVLERLASEKKAKAG